MGKSIGIIGYGSMGKMLLEQFSGSETVNGPLLVSNRHPEKIREVSPGVIQCYGNRELAAKSDIIILCVRPADIRTVLEEIRPEVKPETIVVSLNGSVSFECMGKCLQCKTAKVIPSLTAEINRSQSLACFNELMTEEDRKNVIRLFESVGNVIPLPEKEMGMGSELASCMPGFIASMFDVICESARKHTEMTREQIADIVLRTLHTTGELMIEKKMSFAEVVERVATRGGITEEGAKVIYGKFPDISDELFDRTMEKRALTARKAEEAFGKAQRPEA